MKTFFTFLFLFFYIISLSQMTIKGKVIGENNSTIFAANVYFKNQIQNGTTTDFDGNFELEYNPKNIDTLLVSYIGYETNYFFISNEEEFIEIILIPKSLDLESIEIIAKEPVSEQFSVNKMEQLDIYLNPASNADPLKAITTLASSTNTDESANPSLRGSSSERSRVLLNGVPVYNPVRNSQINGIGFFSLFNTTILEKMYTYASNPPLTYGNSSAGLVEITTQKEVKKNALQLSAGLANAGLFYSKKINSNNHLHLYGNHQLSSPFIGLNQKNIEGLKYFQNSDVGFIYSSKINEQLSFQLYSYAIKEAVEVEAQSFTFKGDATANKLRNFNIFSLDYSKNKTFISFKHGSNFSKGDYQFGNLNSISKNQQSYNSINITHYYSDDWKIQTGLSHDFNQFEFRDTFPIYYYALQENAPTFLGEGTTDLHQLEPYFYTSWDVNSKLILSTGIRTNIPIQEQSNYWSFQMSARYNPLKNHSFLLGLGQYHSYTLPIYYGTDFELLKSLQIALDYDFNWKESKIHAAIFSKKETGKQIILHENEIEEVNILGTEFSWEQFFGKHWNIALSNIFIKEIMKDENTSFRGTNSLNYFLKASAQFNHSNFPSIGISYLARPGKYYTTIQNGILNLSLNVYEPQFSNEINDAQFKNYQRIDLSISKVFPLKDSSIILYASVNNLLNKKNQREQLFSDDYQSFDFNYYQQRTIYFGGVFNLYE